MPQGEYSPPRWADIAMLGLGTVGAMRGNAGFLRGWQRGQAEREEKRRRQQQEEHQRAERQRVEDQRQQELMLRADAQTRQREQDRVRTLESVRELLGDEAIDDPTEYDMRESFATSVASPFGIDPGFIKSLRPKPDAFRQRKLKKLDAQFRRMSEREREAFEASAGWEDPDGTIDPTTGRVRVLTPAQLRQELGMGMVTPAGEPFSFAPPPSATVTFAELYPEAIGTEFEHRPLPTKGRGGAVDYNEARQTARAMGWLPDTSGPTDAERRRQQQQAITGWRDRLTFALRNPQGANLAQIRVNLERLGLDWDVERARIARAIEKEDLALARQRDLARGAGVDVPTAPDVPGTGPPAPSPGARGRGVGPGPMRDAQPAGGRTATRAQVEAVARRQGVTYAEAKRQLEARRVRVSD